MQAPQTWSIIVFAFNEEGNIYKTLEDAWTVLKQISPKDYELIIVNDGSTDTTAIEINNFCLNRDKIILINHKENMGIGKALISGYTVASKENVCAIPADGQFNTEELIPFASIPKKTIISFYREKKTSYSFFRKILSQINRLINRYALGIKMKDVNWIKVYKNEELKIKNLAVTSSLVESEICAKMMLTNKKLIEIKSNYGIRHTGKPKGASLKIVSKAVCDVFLLAFEINRFKKNLPKV
ncbi:MAG: glycosyltransferase family 2 protein [Bacteroidales bacterium]|nr:glycosyltransferase family 2 protein [Bacteroidales bacterium]